MSNETVRNEWAERFGRPDPKIVCVGLNYSDHTGESGGGAGDAVPSAIMATAVCPGYVRTPLVESQIGAQARAHGLPEDRVLEEVILAGQAVKRLLEPDEVAETLGFLLGRGGRAFTGVALTMDLGWTAR